MLEKKKKEISLKQTIMLWLVVEHNLSEIEININFFPDKGRILAGICCEECKKKSKTKQFGNK
jgi:hypothetical protein